MTANTMARLKEATRFIEAKTKVRPKIGFVLGSGLASFGEHVEIDQKIKFDDIPHFSPSAVEGHPGVLLLGHLKGTPVAVMQGRIHAYEGHSYQDVVFPVRTLAQLGVQIVVVTNAAGGLSAKMRAGDLMIIKDQINLTGDNPCADRT